MSEPDDASGRAYVSVTDRTGHFVRSKWAKPHLCQLFFFSVYLWPAVTESQNGRGWKGPL